LPIRAAYLSSWEKRFLFFFCGFFFFFFVFRASWLFADPTDLFFLQGFLHLHLSYPRNLPLPETGTSQSCSMEYPFRFRRNEPSLIGAQFFHVSLTPLIFIDSPPRPPPPQEKSGPLFTVEPPPPPLLFTPLCRRYVFLGADPERARLTRDVFFSLPHLPIPSFRSPLSNWISLAADPFGARPACNFSFWPYPKHVFGHVGYLPPLRGFFSIPLDPAHPLSPSRVLISTDMFFFFFRSRPLALLTLR